MVDPTWKEPCPACGESVNVNQIGQVYPHSGKNGCPYSGTGPLERQHVYPLKFDYRPCMTAAAAYVEGGLGATIRYPEPDEELPAEGEYISMRTGDGDVFGIAKVVDEVREELYDTIKYIRRSKARYPPASHVDVGETLNDYYDAEIDMGTDVVGLIYDPWIGGCYTDDVPAADRV